MPEPTRTLRLHQDIYLPLLLVARSAGISVEEVMVIAFQHFATLPIEEKTRLMYQFHAGPGFSTRRAKNKEMVSKPHFETSPWYRKGMQWLKKIGRLALHWLRGL